MNISKNLATKFLTKDEIRKIAPVVLETQPTNPGVTEVYKFVNTETIIDDLGLLGWFPVEVKQRKGRKTEGTIFSKHMVSFQNPAMWIESEDGELAWPRIILSTSHDGFQAFRFMVGIFRMVCENGVVIADESFGDIRIAHKGYTFEELRKMVRDIVEELPSKVEVLNTMRNTQMTEEQKEELALNAMLIRAGIKPGSEKAEQFEYDAETLEEILEPVRDADKGDDLWTVFNVVQEKMIRGGFSAALTGGQVRKVRAIKGFEKDLKVNQQLFRQAVTYLN